MEIHGTIHFKLILPHFPGFQQEPLPAPVCSRSPECDGCPYASPLYKERRRSICIAIDKEYPHAFAF